MNDYDRNDPTLLVNIFNKERDMGRLNTTGLLRTVPNQQGGVAHTFRFSNGFGASVVRSEHGGALLELAVLRWDGDTCEFVTNNVETTNVEGVNRLLQRVANLPDADPFVGFARCSFGTSRTVHACAGDAAFCGAFNPDTMYVSETSEDRVTCRRCAARQHLQQGTRHG